MEDPNRQNDGEEIHFGLRLIRIAFATQKLHRTIPQFR
jgi:hypothetical protein